jgi:hypothetical protein
MDTTNDKGMALNSVLEKIKELRRFGGGAILRRVIDVIEEARAKNPRAIATIRCDDGGGGHGGDWLRSMSFPDVLSEIEQEDRRRTTLLDPEEILYHGLKDLHEGRIDVLEVRGPRDQDISVLQSKVEKSLAKTIPGVSLNRALYSDDDLLCQLRSLVYLFERGRMKTHDASALSYQAHINIRAEECRFLRTTTLGTRWTNGGRTQEALIADVLECKAKDSCCWNSAWTTTRNQRWEVVWSDGNVALPPPNPPPDFIRRPWDNELPFFADGTNATLTSDWGWRNLSGAADFHGGIDIGVAPGTAVHAVTEGVVVRVNNLDYNSARVVVFSDGMTYTYRHILPGAGISTGQIIHVGDIVGTVRDGTYDHLHFSTHTNATGDDTINTDSNSTNPLP